jgi:AmiR/NasT family two-component response regulator
MERFDVDADRAFAILRRYSQDHNVKLRTIAQRLIEERTLPRDS